MTKTGLKPLPVRSSLIQFKEQVRSLIKANKSSDPEAMRCIRQHHPRLPGRANTNDRNEVTESEIRKARVTLADAQSIVARWHGFESWPKLTKHVELLNRKDSRTLQFELAVEAIIAGDFTTLESLLRENPELARTRSTREHHATLLHYVSANGVEGYRQKTPKNVVEITEILLGAGAEVDVDLDYGSMGKKTYPERTGSTTLGLAATSFHPAEAGVQIALLETLLNAGASVNGLPGGWNPLIAALHNGRGDAAEFLASRGARMDLEGAAGVGRIDLVKNFFRKNGRLKVNATKTQMEAGFAWACEYGRTRVVAFLLQKGIDVSAKRHGQTGLHWAAYGGHSDLVKSLLKRKAILNEKDEAHDGTPLGWALYGWCNPPPEAHHSDYYEVVRLLVAAGATKDPKWLAVRGLDQKLRADPRMLAAFHDLH